MSPQRPRSRCIIQKLDFENCIVTNLKTTTKGRKKLRARITREFKRVPETSEEQPSTSQAPTQRSSSPVLIKRDGGSPVFMKRKKIRLPEGDVEDLSEDLSIEEDYSPGSPVFKLHKKPKTSNPTQESQSSLGGMSGINLLNTQRNSGSSVQIDEFTQESKISVKISSVESSDVKSESVQSVESELIALNSSHRDSSSGECKSNSPRSFRRNYKKNSLLGRLQKLQQKRASEKLLWQHQNRQNSTTGLNFSVLTFWKEELHYFLKCRSNLPDPETNFLIVDSRWVPNVKNVTEGSVLRLHPPWQKLQVDESAITVLLNLICVDVLEEIAEPVLQQKTFESVSPEEFQTGEKSFVDSLFSVGSTGLFW